MSIVTCTFPELWKTATVTPVQKSTKQNTPLIDFRPISILPVVPKILERFVFDAIVGHLNFFLQNNLVFVLETLPRMFCYVLLIVAQGN